MTDYSNHEQPFRDELEELWETRENLSIIRDYAQAQLAAPLAVLGYCMARAVADLPPQITLPGIGASQERAMRGSLNMFVGLVGASGDGKGEARKAASALVPMEAQSYGIGSGQGIAHIFKEYVTKGDDKGKFDWKTRNALIDVSEIDKLAGVASQKASITLPVLRQAWSGELLGEHNADKERRLTVEEHGYRLCMVAGIQPERAGVLLDDSDGGTPQRWLWLPTTDPEAPDEEPPAVARTLRLWSQDGWVKDERSFGDDGSDPGSSTSIYHEQTIKVWEGARREIRDARRARLRKENTDAKTSHALFCRLKTAVGLAVVSTPDTPLEVTEENWQLAGVIMDISDLEREEIAFARSAARQREDESRGRSQGRQHVAAQETIAREHEHRIERIADYLHKKLKDNRGDMSGSDLRKTLNSRDREHYEDARDRALERGIIVQDGRRYDAA